MADSERRTISVPIELVEPLKAHARRLDRTFSWVVMYAIRAGMVEVERLPSLQHRPEAAE